VLRSVEQREVDAEVLTPSRQDIDRVLGHSNSPRSGFLSRRFFREPSLFPAWHTTGMCVVLRRPCVEFRYLKLMIILERRNLQQRV
jgi:hypothetical protein